MAMELSLLTFLVISYFLPSKTSAYSLSEIKPWCSKLPYPDLCEKFFNNRPVNQPEIPIRSKSDFLNVSVQIVLERAINASGMANQLKPKCTHDREIAAMDECLHFYRNTITLLNQTNNPEIKVTPYDIQTWLGTTLNNLEACQQGFLDFRVTDNVMPLVLDKVLQNLTINTLALNADSCKGNHVSNGTGGGHRNSKFPAWVSPADRRLMLGPSTLNDSAWYSVMVAKDGSGHFTTVTDAVNEAAKYGGKQVFVIYVKEGLYEEVVYVGTNYVMMIGDGIGKTTITSYIRADDKHTNNMAATFIIEGSNFFARGITFRNTAGPNAGQAVALRSDSDYSVFYLCSFEAYQDTLYVRVNRQFFRECQIYGTVDFIMGDATVVFQSCVILPRSHLPGRINTITAESKRYQDTCSGMVFHKCGITAAPDLKPIQKTFKTYLGRPWGEYARVVYMKSTLDGLIDPEGWLEWEGRSQTAYYGEYNNMGSGSSTDSRVRWPGFHVIKDDSVAREFSVNQFLQGAYWVTQGIPIERDL